MSWCAFRPGHVNLVTSSRGWRWHWSSLSIMWKNACRYVNLLFKTTFRQLVLQIEITDHIATKMTNYCKMFMDCIMCFRPISTVVSFSVRIRFLSVRPKIRGLAQHGGPPGWLDESDSAVWFFTLWTGRTACFFRTVPVALTGAAQLRNTEFPAAFM